MAPQVASSPVPGRDGAVLHVPVAHHQHVGGLFQLGLPDLLADLLVAVVYLHPEAVLGELGGHLVSVLRCPVGDGKDLHLDRGQPHREGPGKVLGDDADEPLDGAQQGPVDHHGAVLLPVLSHILQVEALGHLEVQLDGAALPGPAQGVGQVEVQLGAVEGAVAGVEDEVLAHLLDGGLEGLLRKVPDLLIAHVVLGHGGQLDLVGQAEGGVDLIEDLHHALDLVLHLVGGHEDVGIVLGEAPHPEQAVEGAGHLVPVDQAQLCHAQGEVPVGVGFVFIHQHAAGAVHGLDGIVLAVDDGGVHVVLVVVPVAGAVPQVLVEDDGGGDLHIAVPLVARSPVLQQGVLQHHALGQEEGETGDLPRPS